MNAHVRAFIVAVGVDDVDLASDVLWQLGVRAIEERDLGGGTVELRTSVGQDDDAVARAAAALDPAWAWRTEDVSTAAAETWRDHARPNWITDDLVVVPAWVEMDAADGVTRVVIEPAGAFGLGDHPTSRLSAKALRHELARIVQGGHGDATVLDVGCGTGVLSIVAAVSGARSVRAIDISADAVAATGANARLNGVENSIDVDDAALGDLHDPYDLVVANILAPVLIASAADLRRLTAPGGRLIISGILADVHDHVLEALRPMSIVAVDTAENWAAITLRH